jgi:hypothetical protein
MECWSDRKARTALVPLAMFISCLGIGAPSAEAFKPEQCDAHGKSTNGPCFGFEFTFANKTNLGPWGQFNESDNVYPAFEAWYNKVSSLCPKGYTCIKEPVSNSDHVDEPWTLCTSTVEYPYGEVFKPNAKNPLKRNFSDSTKADPDKFRVCMRAPGSRTSWYYVVTMDTPTIEINTCPANSIWIGQLSTELAHIWEVASAVGLAPHRYRGGGHIHIDVESGFSSAAHLMNFVTRIVNMGLVALSPDPLNIKMQARPLLPGEADQFTNARNAAAKATSAVAALEAFQPNPFTGTVNLRMRRDFKTVEIRSIAPQAHPGDVPLLADILRRTIENTNATTLIPIRATTADWGRDNKVMPTLTPEQIEAFAVGLRDMMSLDELRKLNKYIPFQVCEKIEKIALITLSCVHTPSPEWPKTH